jgi:DNA (cytosine-5)-methyltransferase 1
MTTISLSAIDAFAGAGGLSYGLTQAGFEVRAAFDFNEKAVETYRKNLGNHILHRNVFDLSGTELLQLAQIKRGDCSLLAGGPPCQGFSIQRRGKDEDDRNKLVLEYFRILNEINPRFFLMENVVGILSKRGKYFLNYLIREAEKLGYRCNVKVLNAADYGVPQLRERVFVVGERLDEGKAYFKFPEPTHDKESWVTVKEALKGLPSPPISGVSHPDYDNHYRERNLSELNRLRISFVPPGKGREFIPEELQLPCHRNNKNHRHLDVYGRLSWDQPSVTLTARFDSFTRGKFAHPEEHRSITLREGARIQTFPDSFTFVGNREQVAMQIGNAVPPLIGMILGNSIKEALLKREAKEKPIELESHSNQLEFAFS